MSIYAAYLYDSVKLYATALDKLIREETAKESLTYAKLMSVATNGSRIVAKMIESTPYKSKTFNAIITVWGKIFIISTKPRVKYLVGVAIKATLHNVNTQLL